MSDKKEVKKIDKATKKVEKKKEFLLKMQKANSVRRLFLYSKYHAGSLSLLFLFLIITVGGVFGVVARIIWEIWRTIFEINL